MLGKTKIVATLGPACSDTATMRRMIEAGMDVARINASHTEEAEIREEIMVLREASAASGREIGLILDLMGPKIRVGEIGEGGAELTEGEELILTPEAVLGNRKKVTVSQPGLATQVKPGDPIVLDDGALSLSVLRVEGEEIVCRVDTGGRLRSHKGVNLPGIRLNLPSVTEKDMMDLELGLELGVDWIALSFVRSADDIRELRGLLEERGSDVPIVAKVEKREAVEDLEAVVGESDAVMVARGDLGVELPLEEIPLIQKRIIEVATRQAKPVITATQMLQSMIEAPSPTRAEVTDVSNAVFEGADAVMLSGETAVGAYPVMAVDIMQRIIIRAETALPYAGLLEERRQWIAGGRVEAVCLAACELALQLLATTIVTPTESGFTASQVSRFRPRQPILAPTPSERVARRLTLYWGVYPSMVGVHGGVEEVFAAAEEVARNAGLLPAGSTAVVTAGIKAPGEEGRPITNTIHCISG